MKKKTSTRKVKDTQQSVANAPKTSERILSWLHISDLHFRAADEYNSRIVLDSLLRDIEKLRSTENLSPDVAFVTGDLANSGKPKEYELVSAFLDRLVATSGVPLERIICVPGNHDVDRSRITAKGLKVAAALVDRDSVSRVIGDPLSLAVLTERQEPYSAFIKRTFLGENGWTLIA